MTDTSNLKRDVIKKYHKLMDRELTEEDWTLNEKVALTCRILSSRGHDSGLSGQITARMDGDVFITQKLGYGFNEATVSNMLTVDEKLNVVKGEGMPNPANQFHVAIYRNRPDVSCIIHTHPLYVSALSMLEEPLKISHMDTCILYDDIEFLAEWPGVPVSRNEGDIITAALKNKRALLLAHHGLIVASKSVEEACIVAIQIERAAQLHLLAEASGKVCDIDPGLGKEAHDWILHDRRTYATFSYYARQVLKTEPQILF